MASSSSPPRGKVGQGAVDGSGNGLGPAATAVSGNEVRTSPASPDEDLMELKDIVSQTLETKGVLGSIRAQLRAAVYTAIDEQEMQKGIHLENPRAARIHETEEGRLLCSLVREYLEFYDLDHTLSVFLPECLQNTSEYEGRETLASKLQLRSYVDEPSEKSPLLLTLLMKRDAEAARATAANELSGSAFAKDTGATIGHLSPSSSQASSPIRSQERLSPLAVSPKSMTSQTSPMRSKALSPSRRPHIGGGAAFHTTTKLASSPPKPLGEYPSGKRLIPPLRSKSRSPPVSPPRGVGAKSVKTTKQWNTLAVDRASANSGTQATSEDSSEQNQDNYDGDDFEDDGDELEVSEEHLSVGGGSDESNEFEDSFLDGDARASANANERQYWLECTSEALIRASTRTRWMSSILLRQWKYRECRPLC